MNIIDRDMYRSRVAKNSIRDLKIHLLEFDKKFEYQIVQEIMKYTYNFIVLSTNLEKKITIRNYYKHVCGLDNVSRILEDIFINESCEEDEETPAIKDTEYIIFDSSDKKNEYVSYYDFAVKSFHFSYIVDNLKYFHICGYSVYNGHAFLRLSDDDREKSVEYIENNIRQDGERIVLAPMVGIGDYFMMLSLLYEYVIRKRKEGFEVYFAVVDNNDAVLSILSTVFPDNKCILFDNGAMYEYLISSDSMGVISLATMHINECLTGQYNVSGYHITETIKGMLGIEDSFNVYAHNQYISECIENALEKKDKKRIDSFFEGKDYVAFQYFTGSYDEVNDVWVTNSIRNWDEENIRRFSEICNKINVLLLVFDRQPQYDINVQQFRTKSVLEYIYALSKVKMLVGIDSSGGHIVSFYSIPSITIWGYQTPQLYQIPQNKKISKNENLDYKISFRPIRKNVSLFSKKRCSKKVYADEVVEQMIEVLNGKKEFEDINIEYGDNKNCICLLV